MIRNYLGDAILGMARSEGHNRFESTIALVLEVAARAGAVACERIVAVVAITERSVARVGCGYNPDGVARGACPACANPPRPKSGEGGAGLSSRASLHHASVKKLSRDFSPGSGFV